MFARLPVRKSAVFIAKATKSVPKSVFARNFSAHGHGHDSHAHHGSKDDNEVSWKTTDNHDAKPSVYIEDNVVVPGFVDTLEWVLDSPPNVHQFEEPPIVVEIDHLENLVINEDQYN